MPIKIERQKDRIRLEATRKLRGLDKRIPGAGFRRLGGPHWSLPLNWETCEMLRKHFRKELEIGPELRDWANAKRAHREKMTALGKAESAELPNLWLSKHPDLWKAVVRGRKYQSAGAKYISEGRKVVVSDPVGMGKTLQALAGIIESELPGPHLIIPTKTGVRNVWEPEIKTWLPDYNTITVPDGRDKRNETLNNWQRTMSSNDFVIVHAAMIWTSSYWVCKAKGCGSKTKVHSGKKKLDCRHDPRKTKLVNEHEYPQLFQQQWGSIIVDESHETLLKRHRIPTLARRGLDLLPVVDNGIQIAQSATPWRSRPHLFWSVLNWLYPDEYGSFWNWAKLVYDTEEGYGEHTVVLKDLNPDREEMLFRTMDTIILRRDRPAYLPSRQHLGTRYEPKDEYSPKGIWLEMTKEQKRAYKEMEEDGEAMVMGGTLDAVGSLAERSRMRQLASSYLKVKDDKVIPVLPSNKFEYVLDILTSELGFPSEPQFKIVIVSQFTSLLKLFSRELRKNGIDTLAMTGSKTADERKQIEDQFNSLEPPHILLLNNKTGGASITIDSADEMWFLDETDVSDDQEQCEGRIDNRRPEEKIVQRRYRYIRSRDTVEVGIAYFNSGSAGEDKRLLDTRRWREVRQFSKSRS